MYVYIINEKPKSVLEHFLKYEIVDIGISSIVYAELLNGVYKRSKINHKVYSTS